MAQKTRAQLQLENKEYRGKLEAIYDNLGEFLGVDDGEEHEDADDGEAQDDDAEDEDDDVEYEQDED